MPVSLSCPAAGPGQTEAGGGEEARGVEDPGGAKVTVCMDVCLFQTRVKGSSPPDNFFEVFRHYVWTKLKLNRHR